MVERNVSTPIELWFRVGVRVGGVGGVGSGGNPNAPRWYLQVHHQEPGFLGGGERDFATIHRILYKHGIWALKMHPVPETANKLKGLKQNLSTPGFRQDVHCKVLGNGEFRAPSITSNGEPPDRQTQLPLLKPSEETNIHPVVTDCVLKSQKGHINKYF